MMRSQQAIAFNGAEGYLPPHHYDQIFMAYGVIMIFFVAMPFVTGLMNFVVPLQIGARDVSFPSLNNFSFWMTVSSGVLVMLSLFIGGVVFGVFADITYWFPKAFGFKLDPFWCKMSFWFWLTGFYFAFMPLYVLGPMGVTRLCMAGVKPHLGYPE